MGEAGYKTTGASNAAPVACSAVLAVGLGAAPSASPSFYHGGQFITDQRDSIIEGLESYSFTMAAVGRMQADLSSLLNRYCNDNWNGYDEAPISAASWNSANEFVKTLPTWVSQAGVSVDADGEVSLEWYRSKTEYLELVFGASGCVHLFMQTKSAKYSDLFKENIRAKLLSFIAEFENV